MIELQREFKIYRLQKAYYAHCSVCAATEGWTIKSNVLGEIKIFFYVFCVWKRRVRKIGLKKS